MLEEAKTKKEIQFKYSRTTDPLHKNGKFFILTRRQRLRQRVLMRNSDSTSTDHSTLSQSFHSTESLRCTETLQSISRDGETTQDNNNGSSMKSPRQLETTTGRTMPSKSKAMVTATTLELLVSTQDGGRCGE
jgi:hypothetical protein